MRQSEGSAQAQVASAPGAALEEAQKVNHGSPQACHGRVAIGRGSSRTTKFPCDGQIVRTLQLLPHPRNGLQAVDADHVALHGQSDGPVGERPALLQVFHRSGRFHKAEASGSAEPALEEAFEGGECGGHGAFILLHGKPVKVTHEQTNGRHRVVLQRFHVRGRAIA